MKKIKGFTLIETIIAIVVSAVIAVAAFGFLHYCKYFLVDSELRLMSVNFARETMENIYWDNALGETLEEGTEDSLPTGLEFGSLLCDEYEGGRKYNVTMDETDNYQIIKAEVQWEFPK